MDKFILSKYISGRGVGALVIFSSIFSIIVLPFLAFYYHAEIFNIPASNSIALLCAGLLAASAFYFYLLAMDIDEASIVIPLFQFDPIFGFILGFFILGEVLNLNQMLAALLILAGIIILSIEIDVDNKYKLKKRVLALVALSSFLFALSGVLFKKFTIVDSFWISIFWHYAGLTIFGLLVLAFYRKFREDFLSMFSRPSLRILSLNIVSEVLYIVGALANSFALLIAPVALVFVVNSYQPLFVFIFGVIFTLCLPQFATEKISLKHLFHKSFSILIIVIGSYLLYSSSS